MKNSFQTALGVAIAIVVLVWFVKFYYVNGIYGTGQTPSDLRGLGYSWNQVFKLWSNQSNLAGYDEANA